MKRKYRNPDSNHKSSLSFILGLLFLLLFFEIIGAISVGSSQLSFYDSLRILLRQIPGLKHALPALEDIRPSYITIVCKIRMPRVFLSVLCGSALAFVGAIYQVIFRNPLADPHILGVSSGAAFGATLSVILGIGFRSFPLGGMGSMAFIGALLSVFFVYGVAGHGSLHNRNAAMILMGVAMSTLLSSIIALLMLFHHDKLEKVYFWTLGSFNGASWPKVLYLTAIAIPLELYLMSYGKELNIMMSGEEEAMGLGLDTALIRRKLVIFTTILVATSVSVSGIIGFVGLIIPHCIRLMKVTDQRKLLPIAAISGALFMLFCDTLARTLIPPSEIPVGIMTALFGVPYFIGLLLWKRGKGEL